MDRGRLVACVVLAVVLGWASQAMAAYHLEYFWVQHRHYEDKRDFNRFSFAVKDDSGNYVSNDLLESFVLTDPDGKPVDVHDFKFGTERGLDGEYDGKNGIWYYMPGFYHNSYYYGDIEQDLIVGAYNLQVKYGGFTSSLTYNFNGLYDLPVVPASSIKTKFDKHGNFIVEWKPPYSLCQTNPYLATSLRVFIDIYGKKKNYVGCLWVRVPTHMGNLFVPKSVLSQVKKAGNKFVLAIQLRTNDNNNRTYSLFKKVVLTKGHKAPGTEEETLDLLPEPVE